MSIKSMQLIKWSAGTIPYDDTDGLYIIWDGDAVIPVIWTGTEFVEWSTGDDVHVESWAKIENPIIPYEPDFNERVGKNIKKIRKQSKLTQHELADLIGVNRSLIANVEAGFQRPPLFVIYSMAKKLGLSFDDFVTS